MDTKKLEEYGLGRGMLHVVTCEADLERYAPSVDMPLDAGIRRYVLALRSGGVETIQSCQGGEGHPCPEPMVSFAGGTGAAFKAYGVSRDFGLPVCRLQMYYSLNDGVLEGPTWELIFSRHEG